MARRTTTKWCEIILVNMEHFLNWPVYGSRSAQVINRQDESTDLALASFYTRINYVYISLFTVVFAISLRYSEKREVYPTAVHFAKTAAANALIDGRKSVELCQAYILLSIYAVPARRWEEDRSWLYTGLAIRIATDLNLHILPPKKPTTEQQELEMLNRTRIWIICFNIDNIVRKSLEWYKSSPNNHPYDVHIIAYTSLFRIVNKFHQEVFSDLTAPNSLNRSIDFRAVTLEHDRLLNNCRQEWAERFERDSDHSDAACEFRVKLLPLFAGSPVFLSHYSCTNYARLVIFSFGFQNVFQRGLEADDEVFFTRVTYVLHQMLLRPQCSRFITPGLETEVYQVIERLIATIGSPHITIDERHTPKLYSRFLASLLAKHKRDGTAQGRMPQQGPPPQQMQTGSST
ncbi:hypothetical protein F5148DRAFT_1148845 [Russula earlei]|uniref:Uncharacterized protein n=1 Tax=Russula earlei TaxID=71964 RepID=A0ACC0UAX2_9AGAM|nr:hypothetical protein F5148DRAFT_1148845 [Russula earlei]